MERLTRRDSDGDAICTVKDCRNDNCSWNCSHDIAVWNKLAEYEDAEEQGLLLKLPCKIGDTVYQHMIVGIDESKKPIYKIYEAKVFKYSLDSITLFFWTETKDNFKYGNEMPLSAFGKTVFLTKAEAEAALADMREKVQE